MPDREAQFNQHRPLLFAIAYHMLGSVMDAEDMLQETFLRWQSLPDDEVQSPRAYLATIITRLSIDQLRSARVQREQYIGPWLPEPLPTGQTATMAETHELADSLSMAFLVLLEQLSPVERAVFLLRDVFDYEYTEVAHIVRKSESTCRQIARRARQHIAARRPRFETSREQQERLTQQFVQTCANGDMQGLLKLFADDIRLQSDSGGKVSAARRPIDGPHHVARLIFGLLKKAPPGFTMQLAEINGQTALLGYLDGRPFNVLTFAIANEHIQNIYVTVNPDKLRRLPPLA